MAVEEDLGSHPWVCVLQGPPHRHGLSAKHRRLKQPQNAFSQLWERQQNIASTSHRRTKLSSRTLQGNCSQSKGVKEMDCRFTSSCSCICLLLEALQRFRQSPKKQQAVFCLLATGFKSLLYPHNFPEHHGPTTPSSWRGSGDFRHLKMKLR